MARTYPASGRGPRGERLMLVIMLKLPKLATFINGVRQRTPLNGTGNQESRGSQLRNAGFLLVQQ